MDCGRKWTSVESGRGRKWTLVDDGVKIGFPENLSPKNKKLINNSTIFFCHFTPSVIKITDVILI
jgi:hypothetical protein